MIGEPLQSHWDNRLKPRRSWANQRMKQQVEERDGLQGFKPASMELTGTGGRVVAQSNREVSDEEAVCRN